MSRHFSRLRQLRTPTPTEDLRVTMAVTIHHLLADGSYLCKWQLKVKSQANSGFLPQYCSARMSRHCRRHCTASPQCGRAHVCSSCCACWRWAPRHSSSDRTSPRSGGTWSHHYRPRSRGAPPWPPRHTRTSWRSSRAPRPTCPSSSPASPHWTGNYSSQSPRARRCSCPGPRCDSIASWCSLEDTRSRCRSEGRISPQWRGRTGRRSRRSNK